MTATIARLHAGDGYTYLTRQVATGDDQRERGQKLTDYYHAAGTPPGRWHGRGLADLGISGQVAEAQMKALFGEGLHPDADAIIKAKIQDGVNAKAAIRSAQLGRRFPQFDATKELLWLAALDQAEAEVREEHGLSGDEKLDREQRRDARQLAGLRLFTIEEQRRPADEAELEKWTIRRSQPTPQPVAGFDVTFTPVKSVSVLWGLSDNETRREIEAAHAAAVDRALDYIEEEAAFTRSGRAGIQQHNATGIVATRFDHFDSRCGDPNLHTHVAIANRVQGPDGKWRTLDGRTLYAANVSFSELYNTALEDELKARLDVAFVDREVEGKRPIREIAGIEPEISEHFSERRKDIEAEYQRLVRRYRTEHGREPDKSVQLDLAQQANLKTRAAKGPMESLADKRERWRGEAIEAVGADRVDGLLRTAQLSARTPQEHPLVSKGKFVGVEPAAHRVLDRVMQDRATWRAWHVRAEAQRQLRGVPDISVTERQRLVEQVTDEAIKDGSILCEALDAEPSAPELTRANGEHVYRVHGSEIYTSQRILDAERELVGAASRPALAPITVDAVDSAITAAAEDGAKLDEGQVELVGAFATADRQLVVGLGPAGTGKTRAMSVLVDAAHRAGSRVIGLAPSAAAASVFRQETGAARADTLDKILWELNTNGSEATGIGEGDVVVVDEAGMAGTLALAQVARHCEDRGARLRLLGDDQQLGAVGAGGALRTVAHEAGAVRLNELHRFVDPTEAMATLQLRDGDHAAVSFYADAGRIVEGSRDDHLAGMLEVWSEDHDCGRTSVMIAGDNATVTELNNRARDHLIAQGVVAEEDAVQLHTESSAGVGDTIVTRQNNRLMRVGSKGDYVKNGDLWTVTERLPAGGLVVKHTSHGGRVTLPAEYVARGVELGYASTVHRAQGMTVDAARVLVDERTTREQLYVALTRGRFENVAFTMTEQRLGEDEHRSTGVAVFAAALTREDESSRSAHATKRAIGEYAASLQRLVPEFEDALAIAHQTQIREALETSLTDYKIGVDDLAEDPAYQPLTRLLAAQIDDGVDVAATMQRAVKQRKLDSAESVPKVLIYRLKNTIAVKNVKPPEETEPDRSSPALTEWLNARRSRIAVRKNELVNNVQRDQPVWSKNMSNRALRKTVLYRDRWGITDTEHPLGFEPPPGTAQHDQWADATKALSSTDTSAAQAPDRLTSLLERAQRRPNLATIEPETPKQTPPDHNHDIDR